MEKPGLERAIPGAFIGIAIGVGFVPFIRWASGITPSWDYGLVLVVTPFTMMVGWLWGIGAFNPKNSEHAHPPYMHHDDHAEHGEHEEHAIVAAEAHAATSDEAGAFAILMRITWKVLTYSLVFCAIFYAIALIPGGFFLQVSAQPEANVLAFGTMTLPFVGEVSQLAVFVGLILAVVVPLLLIGGLLGLAFYLGNHHVLVAHETEPTAQDVTPPPPVRWSGRLAKRVAKGLRNGLPKFFGMR